MDFKSFKNIKIFPDLESIDDFVVKEHPELLYGSKAFINYWREQKKRHIEGLLGKDGDKNRYMPGPLHFYINAFKIFDVNEKDKSRVPIRPRLRDVEWIEFYNIFICQGFSGFMNSDITCHRLVLKKNLAEKKAKDSHGRVIKFTKRDERILNNTESVFKANGELKEYRNPIQYLYYAEQAPDIGLPYYDNEVLDYFNMSPRGYGKSYRLACIGEHEALFDGKKYYDTTNESIGEVFIAAGTEKKMTELANKIEYGHDNLPGAQGEGDSYKPSPLSRSYKGSFNQGEIEFIYSVKENGEWKKKGSSSKISTGIFTTTNHTAAASKRRSKILVDEVGFIPNIVDVHGANVNVVKIGTVKYGMNIYTGTGGDLETVEGPKEIFYNPEDFGFLAFEDIWENSGNICFFIPATYCLQEFKDHLGNTDHEAAFEYLINYRKELALGSSPSVLINHSMYMPLKPSEIFQSKTSMTYPTNILREREIEIVSHGLWDIRASIGNLEYTNNDKNAVIWREDMSETRKSLCITSLNMNNYKNNTEGKIVIYEHPPDFIPDPVHSKSLYKIVYDPYRDDGEGPSLASILVYKGFTSSSYDNGLQNTIVAEYVGRKDKVKEVHEIALKLALYYNSKVLFENNLPGFKNHAELTGKLNLLQRTPYKAISKGATVTRKWDYGVNMNNSLINHCEQLGRQWLLEVVRNDEETVIYNASLLLPLRLIREFIAYNRKGNFDCVSAFHLLMLWLSEEQDVTFESESEMVKSVDELDNYFKQIKNFNKEKNYYYE